MSDVRDEIAETICGTVGFQGQEVQVCETCVEAANAILARFPYMSADRSLYDYAASLREQLNTANNKLEKDKTR